MKKFLLILIFFFSFLSLFFSCDDSTGPPNNNAKLNLTLEDVSCTEVWLKLQVDNPALKSDVIIYRDNVEIKKINNIIGNDTIIYDEELLPNKEYTYRAKKIISESEFIESEEIKAQTMDTTSHNFTFETFTFGEHSSSVLYDVAIIDENNIWAVGEIYMNDSLGNPDPIFYNLAVWDGKSWELKRIFYKGGIWTIRTILAFNENDIWLSGYVRYYNGQFIELPIPDILMGWGINKLWGTSSNDIYAVGNGGNIAHYQNGVWRKIESGTELDIGDILGITDVNGGYNKYLAAFDTMLKIDAYNNLSRINAIEEQIIISIWGLSNKYIYTAGDGIVLYKNNDWEKINTLGINTIYRVKGESNNDVYGIGSPGSIIYHFNGYSWQSFNIFPNNRYWNINIKGSVIAVSGYQDESAVISLIKRNN